MSQRSVPLHLPRGYGVATWRNGYVYTWVARAVHRLEDGRAHVQLAGRMSDLYATPESAAEAAREHASLRGE